ncbi:DUF4062 domain-containing protein [Exiguobacterium sp. S90]|uniref:DUF4062 domain-containing protein n=1 Tax=Exiguobacterium sp. S90 TaxID=1221231 RepID=UPI001BEBC5F5|nr:DUF4062 domain-containing protein [Exiguobacterium sp. S90]
MQKKFQVFISSTYTDLIEERQHAVEAVLNANHIPAGMELFKAGSLDQLQTIERWIDESDIYMLILGGRYGTLEPKSKKSYTHLEFDYALKSGKPIFAIVLTDDMLKIKSLSPNVRDEDVYEQRNNEKYLEFKNFVAGHNRVVAMVKNLDQIKIAVFGAINDIERHTDLKGWIREEDALLMKNDDKIDQEIKDLNNTNKQLLTRIKELEQLSISSLKIGEFTYDEILRALTNRYVELDEDFLSQMDHDINMNPTLLQLLLKNELALLEGIYTEIKDPVGKLLVDNLIPVLLSLDMVELIDIEMISVVPFKYKKWALNKNGLTFIGKVHVGTIDVSGHV